MNSTPNYLETNQPLLTQFFIYVRNMLQGNFWNILQPISPTGCRYSQNIALPWTIALQFPAIIVGWVIGNMLGALAAYLGFDKVLMPISIFVSNFPPFGMAVILMVLLGVNLKWFPTSGATVST